MQRNQIVLPDGREFDESAVYNNSVIYVDADKTAAAEFIKKNLHTIKGSAIIVTDDNKIINEAEKLMKSGKDVNMLFLDMVLSGKGYRPLRHALSNDSSVKRLVDIILNNTELESFYRLRAEYLLYAIMYMMRDTVEEKDITFKTLNSLLEGSVSNKKKDGSSDLTELFSSVEQADVSGFTKYMNYYMLTSDQRADCTIFLSLHKAISSFVRAEDEQNKDVPELENLFSFIEKPGVLIVIYNKDKEYKLAEQLLLSDIMNALNNKELLPVPVTLFIDDDSFEPLSYPNIYSIVGKGFDIEWLRSYHVDIDVENKLDDLFVKTYTSERKLGYGKENEIQAASVKGTEAQTLSVRKSAEEKVQGDDKDVLNPAPDEGIKPKKTEKVAPAEVKSDTNKGNTEPVNVEPIAKKLDIAIKNQPNKETGNNSQPHKPNLGGFKLKAIQNGTQATHENEHKVEVKESVKVKAEASVNKAESSASVSLAENTTPSVKDTAPTISGSDKKDDSWLFAD